MKNHWKLSAALIAGVTAFVGSAAQAKQATAPAHMVGRLHSADPRSNSCQTATIHPTIDRSKYASWDDARCPRSCRCRKRPAETRRR